jgi:SAM-dependent methyltransferase
VDDGSLVYLDPSLHVTWPDAISMVTSSGRLRAIYHDQCLTLTAGDARALVHDGLAAPVGGRLFERPELSEQVFAWDATSEIRYLAGQLADVARGQRGIEFGCGTGRLLRLLRARGLAVDGMDAAEQALRWLGRQLPGGEEPGLVVGDISACAFPGRYGYAIAGLNTLRYLPSTASLRRHMHMAALSVRAGGRYVVFADSWTASAEPAEPGSTAEWTTGSGADRLRVVWSKVRHDPASKVDLERVLVYRQDEVILREFQTQLALSVPQWCEIFTERGEWLVRSVRLDALPAPRELAEPAEPATGNFWFVLERTGLTGEALFTR